jgi:hypothetical protein
MIYNYLKASGVTFSVTKPLENRIVTLAISETKTNEDDGPSQKGRGAYVHF